MKKFFIAILLFSNFTFAYAANVNSLNPSVIASPNQTKAIIRTELPEENFIITLYYQDELIENETISTDSSNERLNLTQDWLLTPFYIKISGNSLTSHEMNVDISISKFILQNRTTDNQFNQYTTSNSMQLINTTPITSKSSYTGKNGNSYKYVINLEANEMYDNTINFISFDLKWLAEEGIISGIYKSDVKLSFTSK